MTLQEPFQVDHSAMARAQLLFLAEHMPPSDAMMVITMMAVMLHIESTGPGARSIYKAANIMKQNMIDLYCMIERTHQ